MKYLIKPPPVYIIAKDGMKDVIFAMDTGSYDVIIIGGGVLGCFAARNFARYTLRVALLEAREDVCTGVTSANTAIVYGSQDHKSGTLKAELCARANEGFEDLCGELGVKFNRCGSLMVCFGPGGLRHLERCMERGVRAGIEGIRMLTGVQARKMEPSLSCEVYRALYCPNTGVVNPWELGIAAAENAMQNGVVFRTGCAVTGIERSSGGGYKVICSGRVFTCRVLFNCAGLESDTLCDTLVKSPVRILPSAADFLVLDDKAPFSLHHVIFHEPEDHSKGLTAVPTTDGSVLLGASDIPAADKHEHACTAEGMEFVRTAARRVLPEIPLDCVIRAFSGIRPNPNYLETNPDTGAERYSDARINDFEVYEPSEYPGYYCFSGIKTPGLTCADELTRYYARRAILYLPDADVNTRFEPKRVPPMRLCEMTPEVREQMCVSDEAWGDIICRCRGISRAEIVSAIHSIPGTVTVDGVKRRAGTCMGRCQGAFCTERIMRIIAEETGCNMSQIEKGPAGSWIAAERS